MRILYGFKNALKTIGCILSSALETAVASGPQAARVLYS